MSIQKQEVDEQAVVDDIIDDMEDTYVEGTANQYSSASRAWYKYLQSENMSIFDATKRNLRKKLSSMVDDASDAHIYAQKSGIGAFYDILQELKDNKNYKRELPKIPENPNKDLSLEKLGLDPDKPKKDDLLPEGDRFLDPEQVEAIVENVPEPRTRNKFLIKLLYRTMVRPSELCNIRLSQIDRENKEIYIPAQKSKDPRTVYYMGNDVPLLMDTWIDVDRKAMNPHKESNYLFITNRSEQLSYQMVNQTVKRAAENAGIQKRLYTDASGNDRWWITGHIFRHSGAMRYLRRGMDISTLAEILGHDDLETTKKYLKHLPDDKRNKARVLWNKDPIK
jgi:integrase/recombinase XerD